MKTMSSDNLRRKVNRFGFAIAEFLVFFTLLAMFCGNVCGQQTPMRIDEIRKKIRPAPEIWSEWKTLKNETEKERNEREKKEADAVKERDRLLEEARKRAAAIQAENERIRIKKIIDDEVDQLKQDHQSKFNEAQEEYKRIKEEIPADEAKQLYEYTLKKINEIRAEYEKVKAENLTVDEVKRIRGNIQRKYDEIQAEFGRIRAKIDAVKEAERKAEAARLAQEAEARRKAIEAARPVNLKEELVKNGFSDHVRSSSSYSLDRDMRNFVQYGNDRLNDKLNEANNALYKVSSDDIYGKRAAQERIDAVRKEIRVAIEEIARKTFLAEYGYSTSDVKDYGNESSFKMTIWTSFRDRMVNQIKVSFPVQNVKVYTGSSSGWSGGNIELSITGSTDSIQELLRGSDKYRARVRFNNLRFDNNNYGPAADVLQLDIIRAGE